jgi:hypothetical protein
MVFDGHECMTMQVIDAFLLNLCVVVLRMEMGCCP